MSTFKPAAERIAEAKVEAALKARAPKGKRARSFIAHYWVATITGPCLLGGVRESASCRFADRADAEARLASALAINNEAGRPARGEIIASPRAPEIGYHRCKDRKVAAEVAQGTGHRCFRCGMAITASALGPRPAGK